MSEISSDDEDGSIEIDGTRFSRDQIFRQTQRIFDVVFVEGATKGDTYGGLLNPELTEILSTSIPTDVKIDEDALNEIFAEVGRSFAEWIDKNVKSVHPTVIGAFLVDFVPACINRFFSVEQVDGESHDYDPSYA